MAEDGNRNLIVETLDVSKVITANATANVSITNVAPAAVSTATISCWLKVRNQGVDYYIPMWT